MDILTQSELELYYILNDDMHLTLKLNYLSLYVKQTQKTKPDYH